MNRLLCAFAVFLFAVAAGPVDQLDRFAGTWQTQGSFVTTPYSKAATATGTTNCAWSKDHLFMICQQSNVLGGKEDHAVAVYTYDDGVQHYRFYNMHPRNSSSGTITIAGDTVSYPFSFDDGGKTVDIRTLNVWTSPNAYTWKTEYSTDGKKTWALMASGTSTKS
jgi:hypothetical protein